MKMIRKLIMASVLTEALVTTAFAQITNNGVRLSPQNWITHNPVFAKNPAALELITNLLAEPEPELSVPEVSLQTSSPAGTYWTLKGAPAPWPVNPFPDLPVYAIGTNNDWLVDDRSVDYVALNQLAQTEAQLAGLTNGTLTPYTFDANGFWIEVPTNSLATPGYFTVMIHNTIQGQSYDVLTKANDLLLPSWVTELVVTGAVGNVTPLQLAMNNRTDLFVQARTSVSFSFYLISPPLSQEVTYSDTVTFSVDTGGNTNLTYQWTSNGVAIPGATNNSYSINKVQDSDAGDYAVIISDGTNSIVTAAAQLTVEWGGDLDCVRENLMTIVGSRQDYTFKSGITYYIHSVIQLYGNTTIEGGAVIKPDWWYTNSSLLIMGTLDCRGEPYNPAVLTSVDDDSAGESLGLSGYDGPPQPYETGVPYLELAEAKSSSISNLRISYADWGVTTPVISRRLDVWDCQFIMCYCGVVNLVEGRGAVDSLHNVLFSACAAAVGAATNAIDVEAEQVTADVGDFCLASTIPNRVTLTNSIVWGNAITASSLSMVQVSFNPEATNFLSSGAGGYYLAADSPLHQSGTINISPRLRAEFKNKTTSPPIAIPALMSLSGSLTLYPQARRYTDGAPDLGYYYDALDYTVAGLTLNGGSITVEPGTAIGARMDYIPALYDYNYIGFDLRNDSSFASKGTPDQPNVFVDVQSVQEQFAWPVMALFVPDFIPATDGSAPPVLAFRFSNFYLNFVSYVYVPAYHFWSGVSALWSLEWSLDSSMYFTLQDCKVHGGQIDLGKPDCPDSRRHIFNYDQVYGPGAVTWKNNLFENVNICLDPTYYWKNQVMNCDLQVQACNNLFRNATWFVLEPVPASAGHWVFEDNLFDKVTFVQDTGQPLDFDYNGYRLLPVSEFHDIVRILSPTSSELSATLLPASCGNLCGVHDKVLSNAPPYQAGPFGNYYLPNTTPLYGAGSRTPADAALYQYTTQTNQTKEGDETSGHMVNIGLHYVAANSYGQPLDSDGDGIPDYVENWHGDGSYSLHTDTETDWQRAMTDGVTPDAYNTVYDNVDLDGDGLTGAAERFFGTNPTNSDSPLNLLAVPQQSTLSGIVQIPLNINTNVDTNTTFILRVNGIAQNTIVYQTNGNWFAEWVTTEVANGGYQLSMEYDFDEDMPVFGTTKFVNAQNDVYFPNCLPMCGSSLYVQPQTINTNGTYTMDVYDDQTNLFASLDGDVDGNGFCLDPATGQPGITVSLLDTNNNQWPSESYTVQVTTFPAALAQRNNRMHPNLAGGGGGGGSSGAHRVLYSHPMNGRKWAIAFMPVYGEIDSGDNSYGYLNEMMAASVAAVVGSAYGQNDDAVVNNQNTTAGDWPGLILNASSRWNQLRGLLSQPDFHNFFYFGHGWTDLIGRNSGDKITSAEMQTLLTNNCTWTYYGGAQLYGAIKHPYRFVFLDGCNTATGYLPLAFGIPPLRISEDDWDNKYHLQPRSFLGWGGGAAWTLKKEGGPSPMPQDHKNFVANFWLGWGGNSQNQLQNSLFNAAFTEEGQRFTELDQKIVLFGSPTLPFYQ